uniref:CSON003377 protein n=1 Tax=Culicoides sonorensis TaxID=179676 RepID=A0A336MMD3_CULSO
MKRGRNLNDIAGDLTKFEKPTIQRYYQRLLDEKFTDSFKDFNWMALKNKMSSLKTQYGNAKKWMSHTGNGVLETEGKDSVEDTILRICAQYYKMEEIFSQRKNLNPGPILNSETYQEIEFLADSENDSPLDNNNDETRYVPENTDHENENTDNATENQGYSQEITDSRNKDSENEPRSKRRKTAASGSAAYILLEMQEKRNEIETERANKQLELEKLKLDLEMQRFESENLKWRAEFDLKKQEEENRLLIRKLELEFEEKIAKQKMETEASLRRFELELKYKKD